MELTVFPDSVLGVLVSAPEHSGTREGSEHSGEEPLVLAHLLGLLGVVNLL